MTSEEAVGIERATLADRIYQRLLDDILKGQFEPGSRLLIAHLASRFGTSQAPVREALRRLTEEGLVVTEPYIGTVLKEPTWEEFQEIYLLRQELEAYAVRRIMSQPNVKFRSDHPARQALRELARAVKSGSSQHIIDADLAFHRAVCASADSPLTLEVWTTIIKRFRGARLSFVRRSPDDMSTIVSTHQMLLDALETGNAAEAEAAFRFHLNDAMDRLRPADEK